MLILFSSYDVWSSLVKKTIEKMLLMDFSISKKCIDALLIPQLLSRLHKNQ